MKKIVNISLFLGLLGLLSSIYYSSEQRSWNFYSGDDSTVEHPAWGVHNSAILSVPNPTLVFAETARNFHSDIDPKSSVAANWTSHQNNGLPQTQYLHDAQSVFVSQTVRILIFPFHSFL